jgi:predicted ArsR family transcriptional regulator
MIEIVKGTMEERILRILQEIYPITLSQLAKKLGISPSAARAALLKLHAQHIVALEPLPGTVFIRLLRTDFIFVGRRTQYKFIKKKRQKSGEPTGSDDTDNTIMYG